MTTTLERPALSEMARWQPWSDVFPWNTRLGQVLDTFWHVLPDGMDFAPSDVFEETDDAFMIELDVPGIAKDDITIDVVGNRVTIKGMRHETERTGVLRRSTRVTGEFRYEVTVPTPIDDHAVTAELTAGVLTLRLPKTKGEETVRVDVR